MAFLDKVVNHVLVQDYHEENCQLDSLLSELSCRHYTSHQQIHDAVLELTESRVCKCKNPYKMLEHARRKNLRKKFQDFLLDKTILDRINDEGRRRKRTVKFSDNVSDVADEDE